MLYKLEVFLKDSVHQLFKNMVSKEILNNLKKNTLLDCKNKLVENLLIVCGPKRTLLLLQEVFKN